MGSLGGWHEIMWRRYPPPGWPFRDETRIPRLSPFTCLFLIILVPLLLIAAPQIWGFLFPTASVTSLSVGACFSGWDGAPADSRGLQTRVRVLDCAQSHESELIDRLGYPEGVQASASKMCAASFASYVGLATEQSQLRLSLAIPSTAEWQEGERMILCITSFPNGAEAGSVRGSGR